MLIQILWLITSSFAGAYYVGYTVMIKWAWYLPGNRPRVPWGTHMNFPLKKFYLFIYLLFLAALGLHCCIQNFSSCNKRRLLSRCGTWAFHCGGFSCEPRALGAWAQLPLSVWNLPRQGVEPVSPASAGRFSAIGPPRKSEFPISVKWPVVQMRHLCCGQKSLFRQNCICLQEREGGDRKTVGRGEKRRERGEGKDEGD